LLPRLLPTRTWARKVRDLQATAMQALADKVRNSKSKSILLSVLYSKIGAVSPIYGTATFSGVEKVGLLPVFTPRALQK
jgi:hypothetical protein